MSFASSQTTKLAGYTPQPEGKRKIAIPIALTEEVVEAIRGAAASAGGAQGVKITFNNAKEVGLYLL